MPLCTVTCDQQTCMSVSVKLPCCSQAFPPDATCGDVSGGAAAGPQAFTNCIEPWRFLTNEVQLEWVKQYNPSASQVRIGGLHEREARPLCCTYDTYVSSAMPQPSRYFDEPVLCQLIARRHQGSFCAACHWMGVFTQ